MISIWPIGCEESHQPRPHVRRIRGDLGELNAVLAEEFPNDRLTSTFFRLDYNFSLYSYERFWTLEDPSGASIPYSGDGLGLDEDLSTNRTAIHQLWWDDVEDPVTLFLTDFPALAWATSARTTSST